MKWLWKLRQDGTGKERVGKKEKKYEIIHMPQAPDHAHNLFVNHKPTDTLPSSSVSPALLIVMLLFMTIDAVEGRAKATSRPKHGFHSV